jgi:hypothetical protein
VIEWSQEVHIIKANLYRELTADVDFDMSVWLILKWNGYIPPVIKKDYGQTWENVM